MIYPDRIYPELEIVEKDISGQKHYGLLRTHYLFGIFPRKKHVKMAALNGCSAYESDFIGARWMEKRLHVLDVMADLKRAAECRYERKMRK